MDDYPDAKPWPYLDKLICGWREEEERQRALCNKEPAAPYGRCRIFSERGQVPTQEWLEEAGLVEGQEAGSTEPSSTPTDSPTPAGTDRPTLSSAPSSAPSKWTVPSVFEPVFDEPDPTSEPTPIPSITPSSSPTSSPSSSPSSSAMPSDAPSSLPSLSPNSIPNYPLINCGMFDVDYNRMCNGLDPCCESDARSDSQYCLSFYENIFPGDLILSACQHCCSTTKFVAPKRPPKEGVPKSVNCFELGESHRISRVCNTGSCCDGQTDGTVCGPLLANHADKMEEICVSLMTIPYPKLYFS